MFIGIRNELRTVGKQIGYQQFPLEHKAAGDERCFISVFFWRLGNLEVIAPWHWEHTRGVPGKHWEHGLDSELQTRACEKGTSVVHLGLRRMKGEGRLGDGG